VVRGQRVADAARRYLYTDERGSITAVTDKDGNVLHVNTYDAVCRFAALQNLKVQFSMIGLPLYSVLSEAPA
jgi:hypothetical protein